MQNENKVIAAFMVILAAAFIVGYLFFGMEEDIEAELPKPTPVIPEEFLKPKTVSLLMGHD